SGPSAASSTTPRRGSSTTTSRSTAPLPRSKGAGSAWERGARSPNVGDSLRESPVKAAEVHVDEEIAEVVRQFGWYAASISDHEPPFLYTIGLMQSFNHPDLILFGLDADNTHALFSQLVDDIRAGKSYAEASVKSVIIGGDEHRVGFRRVHPTQHELYL